MRDSVSWTATAVTWKLKLGIGLKTGLQPFLREMKTAL